MSSKELVSYRFRLKVITPVHIGDGGKYTKTDYVYDRLSQKVGLLNPKKWQIFLQEHNLLASYESKLLSSPYDQKNGVNFDNCKWLADVGYKDILDKNPELFLSILCVPSTIKSINDIHRHVKDVFGQPYIPGSSLKGMLRSAILATQIMKAKEDPQQKQAFLKIWSDLETAVTSDIKCKNPRFAAEEMKKIENQLFKIIYDREGNKLGKELGDPFRGLLVGDSEPFPSGSTMICTKDDLVVPLRNAQGAKIPLQRESLCPGAETYFSVTLDLVHLRAAGMESLQSAAALLDCVKSYRSSVIALHERKLTTVIQQESQTYRDYQYKPAKIQLSDGATCVLGGGVGFQSHSLLYMLAPSEEEAHQLITKLLNKQFPAVHTPEKDRYAAPRTIKTTFLTPDSTYPGEMQKEGRGRYKLGICALKEVT